MTNVVGNPAPIDMAHIRSILIIRLDEIGDMVMTTPLVRELRRNAPNAWITLVVKPEVQNLVEHCPHVNEVLAYDYRTKLALGTLRRHLKAFSFSRQFLRRRRFDLTILPRWDTDHYHGTFLAFLCGARMRVGYSETVNPNKQKVNRGYDRYLTHAILDSDVVHEVEHNLRLIPFLGGEVQQDHVELWLTREDEAHAGRVIVENQLGRYPLLVALGPGGSEPKKRWPVERFGEVARWFAGKHNAGAIVLGSEEERSLGDALQESMGERLCNLAGRTTLRQAGALLQRCALYMGNDSGLAHLAAAAGTPAVVLFGHPATGDDGSIYSPRRFAPWHDRCNVLQPASAIPPCKSQCEANLPHCILGIGVERVIETIGERMNGR